MNEAPLQEGKTTPSPSRGIVGFVFDTLEMFAWALFVVFLLFTFAFRLCQVEGSSMVKTLYGGESLLLTELGYTPKQDDVIVFHLTDPDINMEKTLVKRVIATGGQTLQINFETGVITVDGKIYRDEHAVFLYRGNPVGGYLQCPTENKYYNPETGILSLTVPEHHLFVMGDNRNASNDSRNPEIGFIDERCVLGKVMVRVRPFTVFR